MLSQAEQWLLKEGFAGEKSVAFFSARQKLATGEPLAYLIGHVPFLNCQIYLDSRPLIPRAETEFWVEKVIEEIGRTASEAPSVLDLCAGSGCIGVAIAKALPVVSVVFSEINTDHCPTIQKSLTENNISSDRSNILQSDLFQNINKKYDFILSNPPYIDPTLDRTEDSVKNHEPHLALYGGHNGLELISTIITEASTHLSPDGQLWLEHEPEQSLTIQKLARQNNFIPTTHKDQYETERYSVLMLQ